MYNTIDTTNVYTCTYNAIYPQVVLLLKRGGRHVLVVHARPGCTAHVFPVHGCTIVKTCLGAGKPLHDRILLMVASHNSVVNNVHHLVPGKMPVQSLAGYTYKELTATLWASIIPADRTKHILKPRNSAGVVWLRCGGYDGLASVWTTPASTELEADLALISDQMESGESEDMLKQAGLRGMYTSSSLVSGNSLWKISAAAMVPVFGRKTQRFIDRCFISADSKPNRCTLVPRDARVDNKAGFLNPHALAIACGHSRNVQIRTRASAMGTDVHFVLTYEAMKEMHTTGTNPDEEVFKQLASVTHPLSYAVAVQSLKLIATKIGRQERQLQFIDGDRPLLMPFLMGAGGTFFAAYPDLLFEYEHTLVSLEYKTKWTRTPSACTSAINKTAKDQRLVDSAWCQGHVQAIAVAMCHNRTAVSALEIAAVPCTNHRVKDVFINYTSEKIQEHDIVAFYAQTLYAESQALNLKSNKPIPAYVDDMAVIPSTSSILAVLLAQLHGSRCRDVVDNCSLVIATATKYIHYTPFVSLRALGYRGGADCPITPPPTSLGILANKLCRVVKLAGGGMLWPIKWSVRTRVLEVQYAITKGATVTVARISRSIGPLPRGSKWARDTIKLPVSSGNMNIRWDPFQRKHTFLLPTNQPAEFAADEMATHETEWAKCVETVGKQSTWGSANLIWIPSLVQLEMCGPANCDVPGLLETQLLAYLQFGPDCRRHWPYNCCTSIPINITARQSMTIVAAGGGPPPLSVLVLTSDGEFAIYDLQGDLHHFARIVNTRATGTQATRIARRDLFRDLRGYTDAPYMFVAKSARAPCTLKRNRCRGFTVVHSTAESMHWWEAPNNVLHTTNNTTPVVNGKWIHPAGLLKYIPTPCQEDLRFLGSEYSSENLDDIYGAISARIALTAVKCSVG